MNNRKEEKKLNQKNVGIKKKFIFLYILGKNNPSQNEIPTSTHLDIVEFQSLLRKGLTLARLLIMKLFVEQDAVVASSPESVV